MKVGDEVCSSPTFVLFKNLVFINAGPARQDPMGQWLVQFAGQLDTA